MSLQRTIYDFFDYFPMGDEPLGRGFWVAALTTGAIWFLKPEFAFDGDGNPRQWIIFEKGPNTTTVPFYFPGLLLGAFVWLYV